ncbi:membrane protein [Nocardia vulneris]|uniref:Membrane protein n=1 Tax=Nocardia vulneris TaxID=1141657 RepID=A0ABR4Z9E7_9NOCA|nr:membrane protein [Nocardia vulneris]
MVGAGGAAVLVTAAFVVPRIASESWRSKLYAGAAPLFGNWLPHVGWGTGPAIALAIVVVAQGPTLARRLSWRPLLAVSWAAALGWAFALAMVDGWERGFAGRLTDPNEYLHEVGGVTDIGAMLRGFADRILDFEPDSWTTHVSGHPPGALLFFVLLDRIGLGGGAWAGVACLLIGTSAVLAVAVALRALGAEDRARAALPFLVLAPAALWIAVSADAMFAGVTAWAVALLAIAARPGGKTSAAIAAGVLFALGSYLSYGLVLMAFPAVAVLIAARTARPLLPALAGALVVVAAFTLSGFWWLDGYHLVVQRYYQGIASERSYAYWWWGNLAATVCAVGLATAAGLSRALSPRPLRALDPTALLVAAALCAILAADLSGLSKAETERIWLPFDIWLLAATAFLPRAAARPWLALQAAATLLLVHTILTNW